MQMKNRILGWANVYLVLRLAYSLQGLLYTSGGLLSQLILLSTMLMGLYALIRMILSQAPLHPVYRMLNVLLVMFSIYGLLLILSGQVLYIREYREIHPVRNFVYLKEIYASFLPLYFFYWITKRKLLTYERMKHWIWIFSLLAIIQYYRAQVENGGAFLDFNSNITNNTGYIFLTLLPLMLLWKNKPILMYGGILFCIGFIVISMKRGAILIAAMCMLIIVLSVLKKSSRKVKFAVVLSVVIALVGLYFLVDYLLTNSDYFVIRVEQTKSGDTSHRSDIYSSLWQIFITDYQLPEMLLGRGAWTTLKLGDNFAHNDWLELLINQGILGCTLYVIFWLTMLRTVFRKSNNELEHNLLLLTFCIMFMRTIFSMSYSDIPMFQACTLGFVLAGGLKDNSIEVKGNKERK